MNIPGKVCSIEQLGIESARLKSLGKRVVLCHGTFDLMHTGHIRHLQRARQEGDVLFVSLTADKFVNKGPGRPVFSQDLRAETLAALACVDYVAVNSDYTALTPIEHVKPHVYAKGSDYQSTADDVTGNIMREINATQVHGGRIFYTDEITFSSSSLLNEHFGVFPPETKQYLERFAGEVSDKDIFGQLDSLRKLRVLVVGD
eukprot:gene8944-10996_t